MTISVMLMLLGYKGCQGLFDASLIYRLQSLRVVLLFPHDLIVIPWCDQRCLLVIQLCCSLSVIVSILGYLLWLLSQFSVISVTRDVKAIWFLWAVCLFCSLGLFASEWSVCLQEDIIVISCSVSLSVVSDIRVIRVILGFYLIRGFGVLGFFAVIFLLLRFEVVV